MRTYLFVILLVTILSIVHINAFDENDLNSIIEKNYNQLMKDLKSQSHKLRDFDEDKQEIPLPLPGYQCQHDAVSGLDRDELMEQNQQYHLNIQKKQSQKSLRDVEEIGKIRITFDNSKLQPNSDSSYSCYSVGQVVTVDATASSSITRACKDDGSVQGGCLYTCTQADVVNSTLTSLISGSIIGTINQVLTEFISVNREVGNLELPNGNCHYGVPIPAAAQSPGIANSDYHVFATVRPTSSSGTIAYAKACVYPTSGATITGRPVAGIINFNPRYFTPFLNNPSGITFREYTKVGLHEMVHALGFSSTFYRFYKNPQGQFYNPAPGSFYTFNGTTPSGVFYETDRCLMTTPTVAAFASAHYACPNLGYQELEDYGGSGTAGSHWEKRSAGEELMLGYVQPMFPLTNLTLSLLQDTGWYGIDFTNAEQLLWGKNLGCDWNIDCTAESWAFPGYWCSTNKQSCSPTRAGKGACTVASYTSNLPYQYQHFANPSVGGIDAITDFCPYTQEIVYCSDESKNQGANGGIGEVFGETSRCFEFSQSSVGGMACLQERCNGLDIEINVLGSWYTCPPGKTLEIETYKIPCPTYYYPCYPVGVPVQPFDSSDIDSGFSLTYSLPLLLSLIVIVTFLMF
ncbi:hypothetical protein DLAC_07601 [Tieghemostelium lacteum]|uniref:Peptidase M8 n=1 Tax=Tieghemostelium lacteum TaxID=361077 RepID=A0A151ZD05_TIELA|nr:hypothetical protein DLAC_07601 [Tieghemostelium lacteum]|eukprot:KYQ91805.1 hypothetical protein DLAC_07601 [Tieghemostelium lacteum]